MAERAQSSSNPKPRLSSRLRHWRKRWRQLAWCDRLMLFEALTLLGVARATVLFIPFKRVAPHLGQAQQETADGPPMEAAIHVARAIYLVSRHTPWNSNCFAQALAGHVMLRRRGQHPLSGRLQKRPGVCRARMAAPW